MHNAAKIGKNKARIHYLIRFSYMILRLPVLHVTSELEVPSSRKVSQSSSVRGKQMSRVPLSILQASFHERVCQLSSIFCPFRP